MVTLRVLGYSSLLALGLASGTAVKVPGQSLRLRMKSGDHVSFTMKTILYTGKATPIVQNLKVLVTCKDASPGRLTLEHRLTGAGLPLPDGKPIVATAVYDEFGHSLKRVSGPPLMATLNFAAGFLGVSYPTAPIAVGSTWTSTFDMKSTMNPVMAARLETKTAPMTTHYAVKKIEKRGALTVVTLTVSYAGKMRFASSTTRGVKADESIADYSSDSEIAVDAATGVPISASGMISTGGSYGASTFSERIKVAMARG